MKQKIAEEAWSLDDRHMTALASIASAKTATMQQIKDAGHEADQAMLDRLVSLQMIKREGNDAYRIMKDGRSILWHQRWIHTGYPMFAHGRVIRWALYLNEVFGEIETFRLEMDLKMDAKALEPHLAKMAEHDMIVRDGETAFLLDKAKWKMDF